MQKRRSLKNVRCRENSRWDRGLLPQVTVDLLETQRGRKIDVPRGGKMDWSAVRGKIEMPEALKHKTAFGIDFETIIDAAAHRQKWIDPSQSVNLFLATPDMKTLSHKYRRAWDKSLKTTYYLRTMQASNVEKSTIDVQKVQRGVMATATAATASAAANAKREFTTDEKMIYSIGDECEARQ